MPTENLYTIDCIRTFTGIYMNVFEPTLEMICIEDIAHSLSMQPRFGGHLHCFYSVAEHSFRCAANVPKEQQLAALMHDASEAYLLDVPRPIKLRLSNYKEIEDRLMVMIAEKFGFQYPLHESVKQADEAMLQWEWEVFMLRKSSLEGRNPPNAKFVFLDAYKILTNPFPVPGTTSLAQ